MIKDNPEYHAKCDELMKYSKTPWEAEYRIRAYVHELTASNKAHSHQNRKVSRIKAEVMTLAAEIARGYPVK